MNLQQININQIVEISIQAGKAIMEIYDKDFEIIEKEDKSPLTEADTVSNQIIVTALAQHYPEIPIISEENKLMDYEVRKEWDWCWLVDPIDGTKEFIKKNGEFTVNIALVHKNHVVAGVIYVPAFDKVFYAKKGEGTYLLDENRQPQKLTIRPLAEDGVLRVVGSRSHRSQEVDDYVKSLEDKYPNIEFVAAGSSLKFCLLAEGKADVYPRLAPTMEWDTCAGQIIAQEAGAVVNEYPEQTELVYNQQDLLNPYFIAAHPNL